MFRMKSKGRKILTGLFTALVLAGSLTGMDIKAQEMDAAGEAAIAEEKAADGESAEAESPAAEEIAGGTQTNLQGGLMMTASATEARVSPDADADVVVELPAGSQLLVTGQEAGWYQIFYQGKTTYVPMDAVTDSTEVDPAALEEEMVRAEEEGAAFVESLETQRRAATRSRIWGIVIVVLIVAVFATGVVSAVRSGKTTKGKDGEPKKEHKRESRPRG